MQAEGGKNLRRRSPFSHFLLLSYYIKQTLALKWQYLIKPSPECICAKLKQICCNNRAKVLRGVRDGQPMRLATAGWDGKLKGYQSIVLYVALTSYRSAHDIFRPHSSEIYRFLNATLTFYFSIPKRPWSVKTALQNL